MVNMYKLKLTNLQQEILKLLYVKAGTALNQRQISKILGVTPPAVMKALPLLEKESLIKIKQDKESKRWAIELNRDNHKVMQLKRAENLKMLYETEIVDFLAENFPGTTIILFGSYAFGEDVFDSDIDIAVIGAKEQRVDTERYDKLLGKEVFLHFFESFSKIDKHLRANIINGITLLGAVKNDDFKKI